MTAENTLKPLRVPSPTTEEYGDFKVTKEYVTMDEFEREIKAADYVSVVRCRDCRYYDSSLCNWFECSCCGEPTRVEPDGFCAWGERR